MRAGKLSIIVCNISYFYIIVTLSHINNIIDLNINIQIFIIVFQNKIVLIEILL